MANFDSYMVTCNRIYQSLNSKIWKNREYKDEYIKI